MFEWDLVFIDGHFSKEDDHSGFRGSFHSYLGVWINLKTGVDDSVGNLIAHLIGMALTDRLGGEIEMIVFVVLTFHLIRVFLYYNVV